jgi:glucose-6-phosphate 1-dehydrogenase
MTAPGAFVIFGATGDLARRMLFPSLYFLDADGLLPSRIRIMGAARSDHTDEEFRKDVEGWVRERAGAFFSQDAWDTFAKRLSTAPGDATDPKSYATLKERLEGHGGRRAVLPVDLACPLHSDREGARG